MVQITVKVRVGMGKEGLMALKERIRGEIPALSRAHGRLVIESTRKDMDQDKSGIHWPHLPHRSSAPGESPRTQSGAAARSIRLWANQSAYVTVGSKLWYFNFLQQKRNRPALEPALRREEPKFIRAIEEMIERVS